jgi:hypothetical protein
METYVPKWPAEHLLHWHGPLGRAAIRWVQFAGPSTPDVARALLTPVANFALWSWLTRESIDEQELWKPEVVEHWVFTISKSESKWWKQNARARLRQIGPLIGVRGGWPRVEESSSRNTRSLPYSSYEEHAFRMAALAADGTTRNRKLWVAALAFGAGLVGDPMLTLRVDDFVELADGHLAVTVENTTCQKLVPIRENYAGMLREAMGPPVFDNPFVACADVRNAVSRMTSGIEVSGVGPFKIRRARATWICHHLLNETPLTVLFDIAAPLSGSTLEELVRFLPQGDLVGWTKAMKA